MSAGLPRYCRTHPNRYGRGCADCRAYARARAALRYRMRAYGQPIIVPVDAEPAREHIRRIQEASGASLRWIAERAGVSARLISEVMSQPERRIAPDNRAAILGVVAPPHGQFIERRLVDALGARRMLQALAMGGYGAQRVAILMGRAATATESIRRIRDGRVHRIERRTRAEIERVYDECSWDLGPSIIATRFAFDQGWQPCDAWSHETIEDPNAQPYQHLDLDEQYVDEEKLARVRSGRKVDGIRYRFIDCNREEQRVLLREHLAAGGKVRGFRDRHRPAPMELLRSLEREIIGETQPQPDQDQQGVA